MLPVMKNRDGRGPCRGRVDLGPARLQVAGEVRRKAGGDLYTQAVARRECDGRVHVRKAQLIDLPGFCLARLREAGVNHAEWTGHCTYADEARFYSYRRACHRGEDDYGRLVAAIAL